MSVAWVDIQSAIRLWVSTATGLDDAHVIWADQDGPRPSGPYVSMRLTPRRVGHGWLESEDNGSGTPGAEITHTYTSIRALELELQCFGGGAQGVASSHALLDKCIDYAGLPSQKDAFVAAGWSPAIFDPIQSISGVLGGSTFEPRAVLRCRGTTSAELSETGTYIELVHARDNVSQPNRGLIIDLVDEEVTFDPKFVTGNAIMRFAATGDGVISGDLAASGSASLVVSASASPIAVFAAAASASMTVSATGTVVKSMPETASADMVLSASSEIFLIALASASASMAVSATGDVVQNMSETASASLTVSATGNATLVPGGPNLLLSLDFSAPLTSWTTGRTNFTSAYATDEWILSSPTTGSYANNVGSATLDNTGGLEDQVGRGIYDGTNYFVDAWEGLDDNDYLECSDTTVGDPNGNDFCVRVVYRVREGATDGYVIAKWAFSGGVVGWNIQLTAGGVPYVGIGDGTTYETTFLTGSPDARDGAWHYVTFWWDESAQTIYIKSDQSSEVSETSAVAAPTNTAPLTVNRRDGGGGNGNHMQVAYVGICEGANAQSMYDETFWQHGQDPTGLLDTKNRNCLISVPLGSWDAVGHFSGSAIAPQLPIGDDGTFTSGYGLYCNSAVTNLIAYSRASTGATNSNVTPADNNSDANDGFRAATLLTADADNGYQAKTVTTVASTDYCGSVCIKQSTAGVTGRVIAYDESNTAELASQVFTGTGSWQRIEVPFSTVGGGVSTSLRVEIDTNGESVLVDHWQVELGSEAGAIIPTSGSSASLVASDYLKTGTAGQYCKGDKGEIEMVINELKRNTTSYFMGAYVSSISNQDARYMAGITSNYNFQARDTAGASPNSITVSGRTASVESTLLGRWDDAAGLAVGSAAAQLVVNGAAPGGTDPDTWTSGDTTVDVRVGGFRNTTTNMDGFVQSLKIWDAEGGAA